jgi:hypothetical protein
MIDETSERVETSEVLEVARHVGRRFGAGEPLSLTELLDPAWVRDWDWQYDVQTVLWKALAVMQSDNWEELIGDAFWETSDGAVLVNEVVKLVGEVEIDEEEGDEQDDRSYR